MRGTLRDVLVYWLAWISGVLATYAIARDSSSVGAYAFITGWWVGCFVAGKTRLAVRTVVSASATYLLVFLLIYVSEKNWMYHDIVGVPIHWAVLIGIGQALVFASPIVFNALFDTIIHYVRDLRGSKSA
jgi:hypothetical protein